MAIASAVAIVAMSYLAVDAGLVSTNAVTKRIEVVQASIVGAATSHHQLAFAVQAWARGSHEKPAVEHCMAID
ncbi:hypothetical protein [Bradyrhizobium sp. 930_D9_N1_4]|uniref:hypothetical protein n=1 Tax=Bradyrhizobium sp. 930_D9_N1_4 TaxID=3240374 RepID=UPI003F8C3B43